MTKMPKVACTRVGDADRQAQALVEPGTDDTQIREWEDTNTDSRQSNPRSVVDPRHRRHEVHQTYGDAEQGDARNDDGPRAEAVRQVALNRGNEHHRIRHDGAGKRDLGATPAKIGFQGLDEKPQTEHRHGTGPEHQGNHRRKDHHPPAIPPGLFSDRSGGSPTGQHIHTVSVLFF